MKSRDLYFDNLKAILIFLVVLGHFFSINHSIPLIGAFSNVIYSFHMPIFVFVSGYFSKNITSHRPSDIQNILYPYVIFQLLNFVFTKYTGFGVGSINIFVPAYQNWYLLGLFIWRLLIPYYNFFDKKYSLIVTLLITFTMGFVESFNVFLGLYRILYFFPIFILGYYCSDLKELVNKFSKYKYLFICISIISLVVIFMISIFSMKNSNFISTAYTPGTNYNNNTAILYLRLIGFFSSLIISFGLLFLIPHQKLRITYLGENTMNIFLLHMFLVFPIKYYLVNMTNYMIFLVALISSILICLIFSNKLVDVIMNPLTKMRQLILLLKKVN